MFGSSLRINFASHEIVEFRMNRDEILFWRTIDFLVS